MLVTVPSYFIMYKKIKGKIIKGFRLLIVCCVCILSPGAYAAPKDLKGSADHPLISRYPGTRIVAFVAKDFDEYQLLLSAPTSKSGPKQEFKKSKNLEGKITRVGYIIAPDAPTLKIYRNFESALKKYGFTVMFSCKKRNADII